MGAHIRCCLMYLICAELWHQAERHTCKCDEVAMSVTGFIQLEHDVLEVL